MMAPAMSPLSALSGSERYRAPKDSVRQRWNQRQTPIPLVVACANVVGKAVESAQIDLLEEIQCNHCRLSLNYPKGIASHSQPSQQFENWCHLEDNCRLTWS
jgi:hypothetical protein